MKGFLIFLGVVVMIALMVAGAHGYKIYGKATVAGNRKLTDKASVVIMFEQPNVVVTEGGERIVIKDFKLADEMKNQSFREIGMLLYQQGDVHVVADASFPSGYGIELRHRYGCGNTFFPRWLPRRLPKYRMEDLGEVLRRSYFSADHPAWSRVE